MAKPKLIVFDLDYTLWPLWVECYTRPFQLTKQGVIVDRHKSEVECFPDVPDMLKKLKQEGYAIGIASRTSSIREAEDLIKLFNWTPYITYTEIYPGSKVTHFNRFHKESKFKYKDMLFFDDEDRNIAEISQLGVTCIHSEEGVSWEILKEGLDKFAAKA